MRWQLFRAPARMARLVALALPVAAVVGVLAQGQGYPVTTHPMDSGGAWFPSLSVGKLTLIDGPSKQVVTEVNAADPGATLTAEQAGAGAYAVNHTSGTVTYVDGATYQLSSAVALIDGAGPGLQVLPGDRWVYVLDHERGAVVTADRTLRRSQPPASLAASVADGLVDADGRLWALDGTSGDLISVDDTGKQSIDGLVDPAEADLELAKDRIAVIDRSGGMIHVIDPQSRQRVAEACIDIASGDRSVRVGGSADVRRVHAVSGQRGTLLTSDLDSGDCSSFVQVADPGAELGVPEEAGGRVFVPNISTGQVHIVDISDGEVTATADLFKTSREFELLARNGIVFYNDPQSHRAGVIDLDGTVHQIDKYNADNRGDQPKNTRGRGTKGDNSDRKDDKQDGDREDTSDQQDGDRQDDRQDGDQRDRSDRSPADGPPSTAPGSGQPLEVALPEPDVPVSLGDVGLPPLVPPDDPEPGPPVIGDPVPPPGELEPPPEPPVGGPSEDPDDPGVEPPIALIGCTDSTPTVGDQLDCSWMVPPAGPDDPPGTSYGGFPDTWEWSLSGPEGASSDGQFFTHTMSTPGTYTLTLTVANAADRDVATRTIEVVPAPQQAPQITGMECSPSSSPPRVGDTVSCTATTSGDVASMRWEWLPPGDDAYYMNEQQSLSENFRVPGTHRIRVIVEGPEIGGSQDERSQTFAVQAEPLSINTINCTGPGQDGPTLFRANTRITCNAAVTSQVTSYQWSMSTGETQTSQTFSTVLPPVPAERSEPHWVEVRVDGPGGNDTERLNFMVYECAPPGRPASC